MRIRHLIELQKVLVSDTGWAATDMPPRHCPIYAKTKPMRNGWQWRSLKAECSDGKFILVGQCNTRRDDWKAWLIVETEAGPSLIARYEHHSSHPGLHTHAHCERGGLETGASSIDQLPRIPPANGHHRRVHAFTEESFWRAAKHFFRIRTDEGPLFNHAP